MSTAPSTTVADQPPQYPTTQCRGPNCQALIIWAITEGRGQEIPIDAEPVKTGNILLIPSAKAEPRARVVRNPGRLFGKRWIYQSHFVSCPHAKLYRTRR